MQVRQQTNNKNMFNLKRKSTESTIAAEEVQSPAEKKKMEKKILRLYNDFDRENNDEVQIDSYSGTPVFKIGQWDATYTLPIMTVKFNHLGIKGTTECDWNPPADKAKYDVKLIWSLSDRVQKAVPNGLERQAASKEWINKQINRLLTKAWEQSGCMESHKKKIMKQAKKKGIDGLEHWLASAKNTVVKQLKDDEGNSEDYLNLSCKMQFNKYETVNGVKTVVGVRNNRPSFWKPLPSGEYGELLSEDVPYVVNGSEVVAQMSFRIYTMGGDYGVAGNLGNNVVFIIRKKSAKKKVEQTILPYLADEEDAY